MKILKGLFYILIVVIGVFGGYTYHYLNKEMNYNLLLEIEKGKPLKQELSILPFSQENMFKLYLKYRNNGKNIKAGVYHLQGEMSIRKIVGILENGKGRMVKVTVPDGYSIKEMVKLLSNRKQIDEIEFYKAIEEASKDFPYPTPNGNMEGYLYPETYFLPEKFDETLLVKVMLEEFLKNFPPEKYEDKDLFYKKLIMASILEREAMKNEEKKLMASVFYNRMKKGMTLSSDATVNYVYDYQKRRMYYKDLKIDSPYNTYKYKGLPPAPISNPSSISVEAAYNPATTEYLFFVAKGDGYHYFSKTYKEHLEFQRKNKKR